MRYHSLVLEGLEGTGLRTIATAQDDGTIQAIAHETLPCIGVQFHPESIGTEGGLTMIKSWAQMFR
jgi:anthranilate/para-aminobenzoate synthase component II